MRLDAQQFETESLRFDPLEEAHRDSLRTPSTTTAMWNWMPLISSGASYDSYFNFCLAEMKTGSIVPFVITRKSDDAFAGLAAYSDISYTHRRLRLGYLWHPPEMRGTEVSALTLHALFERACACRFRRIEFQFSEDNAPAIAAVERIGAKVEGVRREYYRSATGTWVNAKILSLLGEEIDVAMKLLQDRVDQIRAS
jgi:RimJ/RimL family protein N-acetyltransferase